MGSSSPSATPYMSGEIRSGKRSQISPTSYDFSFKILVIGDSGVGKSSLLLSFISTSQDPLQDVSPTIGNSISMYLQDFFPQFFLVDLWVFFLDFCPLPNTYNMKVNTMILLQIYGVL